MIQPETWQTIHDDVRAAWSVVGPLIYALVGLLVGAYLTNRNQQKYWVADNKRAEYRELLTALSEAFTTIVRLRGTGVASGAQEQRLLENLELRANIVILDRIFIADDVAKMEILNRWNGALQVYDRTLDKSVFGAAYSEIRHDVALSAAKIITGRK